MQSILLADQISGSKVFQHLSLIKLSKLTTANK